MRARIPKKRATAPLIIRYDGVAMKNPVLFRFGAAGALSLAFPALTQAHSDLGTAWSCSAGLAHPFLGWDHLLAMVAVGIWAAQLGGRARWLLPVSFVGAMAGGAFAGANGFTLPVTEAAIFSSILVFGLLIATAFRIHLAAVTGITVFFAAFHGLAHGAETPASGSGVGYLSGLMIGTAALHAIGFLAGSLSAQRSPLLPRALGGACIAAGLVLRLA